MKDPDKLFILHPNIWTLLEQCSWCTVKAQRLQTSPSLSSAKGNQNYSRSADLDDWVLLSVETPFFIDVFLMRSKAEFQLITLDLWRRRCLQRGGNRNPGCDVTQTAASLNTGNLFSRVLSTLNDTFQRILWIFSKPQKRFMRFIKQMA